MNCFTRRSTSIEFSSAANTSLSVRIHLHFRWIWDAIHVRRNSNMLEADHLTQWCQSSGPHQTNRGDTNLAVPITSQEIAAGDDSSGEEDTQCLFILHRDLSELRWVWAFKKVKVCNGRDVDKTWDIRGYREAFKTAGWFKTMAPLSGKMSYLITFKLVPNRTPNETCPTSAVVSPVVYPVTIGIGSRARRVSMLDK